METLGDLVVQWFAQLHAQVFEGLVLPAIYALGFSVYADAAFDATELFIIGILEVLFMAVFFGALEKWRPLERWSERSALRADVIYTLINRLGLAPLLLFFLLTPVVDGVDGWLRMRDIMPLNLENFLPGLAQHALVSFLLYLIILDFFAYWLHRWQHRLNSWWALHSLHHSQRQMGFWSDNRNHMLDMLVLDGCFALIALIIGVAPAQFAMIVIVTRMIESLAHINARLSFGVIGERLLVSPRFHRLHHAMGVGHEGAKRGCNFAVLFPLWDILFGSANFAKDYRPTGISDQLQGRDYGAGFWRQQWLGIARLLVATRSAFSTYQKALP